MAAEFPPWPYLERPVYSREGPVPYEPWPVEEWPVEPWPGAGGAGTRPGFALFVAAFLRSPLVLVCWAGGGALLRFTGWPAGGWLRRPSPAGVGVPGLSQRVS